VAQRPTSCSLFSNNIRSGKLNLLFFVALINDLFISIQFEPALNKPIWIYRMMEFHEMMPEYFVKEPQFAPPYINMDAVKLDYQAANILLNLLRQLNKIVSTMENTAQLAGSEAYVAALAYYNSVIRAAQKNVPGAKVMYEDLNKRFKG
jgi:hypothetical protein